MFDILIIGYLFLGGAGSGALIILSFFEFFYTVKASSRPRRFVTLAQSFPSDFFSRAWSLCIVCIVLGILCLILDLGRFDRVLHLLFDFSFSTLSIGAYSLVVAFFCALFFTVVRLLDTVSVNDIVLRFISIVGIVAGIVAALYTGLLLQNMTSVLIWNTPLLPSLFMLSSLSTGIACLFFASVITDTRKSLALSMMRLARVDGLLIGIELVCLGVFLLLASQDPRTFPSVEALVAGDLAWIFWGLLVCGGLVLPLVLERYLSPDNVHIQLLWITLLLIVGGFALRYCLVEVAQYDVTQTLEYISLFGREAL